MRSVIKWLHDEINPGVWILLGFLGLLLITYAVPEPYQCLYVLGVGNLIGAFFIRVWFA